MGELELEKLRNGVAGFHLHLQGIHSFSILAACVTRIVRGVVIGGIGWGMVMRSIVLTAATVLALIGGFAHAKSTNDETFANAALRELHNLAVASAQSERSAKDSDRLGCRDAYDSLQKAAHEALTNMHRMSFAPIGALNPLNAAL